MVTLLSLPATAQAGSITTYLDDRELTFPTPPVVVESRTLVPARKLLEALGATVRWDPAARVVSATLGSTEIQTAIGAATATVNGKPVALQVPARIVADYTLIPLRFFAENLGLVVSWESSTQTVFIDSRSSGVPSRSGPAVNRKAAQALEVARTQVGAPYAWGGTSPAVGFDCSGLITYIAQQVGTTVPRTSYEMFATGSAVRRADLVAGDLVFFTTYAEGASHVGIYDGQGGFVHAQSPETGVKVTPLANPWWESRYLGARRVFR